MHPLQPGPQTSDGADARAVCFITTLGFFQMAALSNLDILSQRSFLGLE